MLLTAPELAAIASTGLAASAVVWTACYAIEVRRRARGVAALVRALDRERAERDRLASALAACEAARLGAAARLRDAERRLAVRLEVSEAA